MEPNHTLFAVLLFELGISSHVVMTGLEVELVLNQMKQLNRGFGTSYHIPAAWYLCFL